MHASRRNAIAVALGVTIISAASLAAQAVKPANADVPITKVILFSSGVGYFEHTGLVHGNAATELRFKTSQINDILKSIMLQDQDGGKVGAITYPSQDPLSKTLKSFQVDITQNPSLAQLLNQLRGARVTIQLAGGSALTGTVLGVETRSKAAAQGAPVSVAVLNVLSGATIREVELPSISNLTLDDAELQDELTKALAALVQARDQDKKPVTINFTGTGDRRVRIGYVVETPIWKTSYRLLLGDKNSGAELQGWAIVENQTESDWKGVSLALVSGRPISFIMDLYQPLYTTRPTVVPELYAGLHPQVYAGGTEIGREPVTMEAPPEAPPAPARSGAIARKTASCTPRTIGCGPDGRPVLSQLDEVVVAGASDASMSNGSVQSIASTGTLGDLFQYTVGNVTLGRQKSAMLPIITDSVQIERVSIYNEGVLRTNPLNGVWMKNTTGKHLLQGPVTVLEKGGYAGDAQIDNVPPGQDRLLSYGIDLEMPVTTTNKTTEEFTAARISRGLLMLNRRVTSVEQYSADNKSTKDKTLVVEHPLHPGWDLIDTQKPFETTPSLYRFKGTAAANKVTTLTVTERQTTNQNVALVVQDPDMLGVYIRTGNFPKDVQDALGKIVVLKRQVVDVNRQAMAKNGAIAAITTEQNRIRENMKAVAPSGEYYGRLLAKLNDQETQIEKLQADQRALVSRAQELQKQLDDYVMTLTVG